MQRQFVTYEIALTLKELGFDENCFGYFINLNGHGEPYFSLVTEYPFITTTRNHIIAPLWQQAINWLLKKLDFYYPYLRIEIFSDGSGVWYRENNRVEIHFDNLEQAILKAIDIIKKEQNEKLD